ncbi:MAG: biopolymer transporter ExbD [Bacteroidota bacterium]
MQIVPRKKKTLPVISTASLPDIIFILLFFFMVVTVFQAQKLVEIELPRVSEIETLENRSLIHHIYVGKPINATPDAAPVIQFNDAFHSLDEIPAFVAASCDPVFQGQCITSLKVDKGVTMGIITDVKTKLRQSDQLKINYAALEERY